MSIPVVGDYNLYAFMWDKFGYKPHEVDELDVNFVKAMITVASAENRVIKEKMNQRKNR